jgi:hypothetical protein
VGRQKEEERGRKGQANKAQRKRSEGEKTRLTRREAQQVGFERSSKELRARALQEILRLGDFVRLVCDCAIPVRAGEEGTSV